MSTDSELWKRKLLAFLHDPPEKAYDYGPRHEERADLHAQAFGLSHDLLPSKNPDWTASAADRFVFPHGTAVGAKYPFQLKHPFSGESCPDVKPPEQGDAEQAIGDCRPDFVGIPSDDFRTRFWLVWRLWMEYATGHKCRGAEYIPYLPADTRIGDSTIWSHLAVTGAIEGARSGDAKGDPLKPAFLLFQMGPVQDFIGQARSTRDLWSGSYMLSWLIAYGMFQLARSYGPDCIIFPSLRGQPLIDWLSRDILQKAKHPNSKSFWDSIKPEENSFKERLFTPDLPNRFLAVVPHDYRPDGVVKAINAEWQNVVEACRNALDSANHSFDQQCRKLWDFQVEHFWQMSWQIWPWQDVDAALSTLPSFVDSVLPLSKEVALGIRDKDKDHRCYEHRSWKEGQTWKTELILKDGKAQIGNRGWAWSAHYDLASHRLDARRQARNFDAWKGVENVVKDDLSGKEETVIDEKWLEEIRKDKEFGHRFRKEDKEQEHLGAVNLMKRVWDKAYLVGKRNLDRAARFDSVPAIAAAPWKDGVAAALVCERGKEGLCHDFDAFGKAVDSAAAILHGDLGYRKYSTFNSAKDWLEANSPEILQETEWEKMIKVAEDENSPETESAKTALQCLRQLCKSYGIKPGKYYAVLALDGDEIGKWLSGEKSPKIRDVITPEAVRYFEENIKNTDVKKWLDSPRPVSPSFHLQLSEALSNFVLYCARRIVEHHHGQLIYAGGDDVLAMLPADEAIECALGLRMAFRGSKKLQDTYVNMFSTCPEGFIKLKEGDWNKGARRSSEPSWPLLVPGSKATVSVGIAIGHIKEPLQDMVHEAQAAEKRAKAKPEKEVKPNEGWNRDAIAVTLYKRSGETIRWGAKFDSKAFDLWDFFRKNYRKPLDDPKREMPISGKFPYRVAELLRKYDSAKPLNDELLDIAKAEMRWVRQQQTKDDKALRDTLRERCDAYLDELAFFSWKDNDTGEIRKSPRPLNEFINIFAVEAFISRQGE